MAREKMVTRTIEVTTAHYTALDVTTSQVMTGVISITGNYSNEDALKYAKKHLDTDVFKVVIINELLISEKLYGMLEYDFIEQAVELDPETRKPL